MHIEKNVFNNIMHTIFDIPRKTKDNMNAWKDLHILCDSLGIDVPYDNTVPCKPKTKYILKKNEKFKICSWVKSLRFLDSYTSNLGRCVDINECWLKNMKSHDCHVFMQRLTLIAYKEILPYFIWSTLIEVYFFRPYALHCLIWKR